MYLASGDQLAIYMIDQKNQQLLLLQKQLTMLVYKYPNTLLKGCNCEAFFYTGFQSFPGGIKPQFPMVVVVLMMQLSFPISLITPFSVFPGHLPNK